MIRISLAAGLVCFSASALAGRPLATEDAGFIEKGGFESENYFYGQREPGTDRLTGFHTQFSAGIGLNTQLGIGLDISRQYNADYDAKKSSGAQTFGGKTGIKELTDDAYGIAVAYGVDRTRSPAEKYRYDNAYINGVVTVPKGDWLFHGNLGWKRSRLGQTSGTTWALAAERTGAIGPVDLAVETFGDDHEPAWVQVAARWTVVEDKVFVDFSYGEQLKNQGPKLTTLGFKFAF